MMFAEVSHLSAAGTRRRESERLLKMKRTIQASWAVGLGVLVLVVCADAQAPQEKPLVDPLQWLNASLEQVTTKISPAVVRIEVAGYRPLADRNDEDNEAKVQTLTKEHTSGSGVIVDPEGYIVTAFHVVKGARRLRVELDSRVHPKTPPDRMDDRTPKSSFEAAIVGTFEEADLAVLKIDARDLPVISFSDSANIKQGELVAALGSPEGLRNSLSLGVVSSVDRQIEPDDSMAYIQTDAAIASGSSGGPLVDVQGAMVGINVFSITERGREQGLGFAVPSAMVRFVYEQIRQYGCVPRAYLGVDIQGVTPTLASALRLPTDSGVIVAGGAPGSPAENAALQAGDLLASFDGTQVQNVTQLTWALLHKRPGDHVKFEIWRNSNKIVLDFSLVGAPPNSEGSLATMDIEENKVIKLGIVGSAKKDGLIGPPSRESKPGVLVMARLDETDVQPELKAGDVIRSVNATPITSVAQLRATLDSFKPGDAVALQVERKGKLMYVAFEMD
jgi:serine protease Do